MLKLMLQWAIVKRPYCINLSFDRHPCTSVQAQQKIIKLNLWPCNVIAKCKRYHVGNILWHLYEWYSDLHLKHSRHTITGILQHTAQHFGWVISCGFHVIEHIHTNKPTNIIIQEMSFVGVSPSVMAYIVVTGALQSWKKALLPIDVFIHVSHPGSKLNCFCLYHHAYSYKPLPSVCLLVVISVWTWLSGHDWTCKIKTMKHPLLAVCETLNPQ